MKNTPDLSLRTTCLLWCNFILNRIQWRVSSLEVQITLMPGSETMCTASCQCGPLVWPTERMLTVTRIRPRRTNWSRSVWKLSSGEKTELRWCLEGQKDQMDLLCLCWWSLSGSPQRCDEEADIDLSVFVERGEVDERSPPVYDEAGTMKAKPQV